MMHLVANARERAKRNRSLEPHLSPETLKRVARRRELLELSAQTRTMSFLVCRIRGFAELAESVAGDPETLALVARQAMTPMAQAVLDRDGTIDRIMAGELFAFFNAPHNHTIMKRPDINCHNLCLAPLSQFEFGHKLTNKNCSLTSQYWQSGVMSAKKYN